MVLVNNTYGAGNDLVIKPYETRHNFRYSTNAHFERGILPKARDFTCIASECNCVRQGGSPSSPQVSASPSWPVVPARPRRELPRTARHRQANIRRVTRPHPVTPAATAALVATCLLYTSDAANDLLCVDLGGRRIIKK